MRAVSSLLIAFVVGCGGAPKAAPTASTTATTTPAAAKVLVFVDDTGVGLGGHDPVAYLIDGEATPGTVEQTSAHGGATYRFASAEHKATFEADRANHVPRFGGYCAFAASQNRLSEADPTVFQIIDGRLLVFTDQTYKSQFNVDARANLAKADQNWPGLVERYGK